MFEWIRRPLLNWLLKDERRNLGRVATRIATVEDRISNLYPVHNRLEELESQTEILKAKIATLPYNRYCFAVKSDDSGTPKMYALVCFKCRAVNYVNKHIADELSKWLDSDAKTPIDVHLSEGKRDKL